MSSVLSSMAPAPSAPAADGLVSRVRRRLFAPATPKGAKPPRLGINFQASIAEFLLVHRLKARSRRACDAEMLERASHIVFVTCHNWFGEANDSEAQRRGQQHHQTRL